VSIVNLAIAYCSPDNHEQPSTFNLKTYLNLHKTKGIVLRTIKYGETSIVVTIFTEAFGIQSYLVNGVRAKAKKSQSKINLFQPAAILQLVVYRNELKNLQRIRESGWAHLYENIFFDVVKNAVALYITELLLKCLKQPETGGELFEFAEDVLLHLDKSEEVEKANYPLFFAVHFATFLGLRMADNYSDTNNVLDLQEGMFISQRPEHRYFLEGALSAITAQLLRILQPHELGQIKINKEIRKALLNGFQNYYALHIQDFGILKSLPVLQTVFSG
jgi:DNA repair protein RecO (recombination protein O)